MSITFHQLSQEDDKFFKIFPDRRLEKSPLLVNLKLANAIAITAALIFGNTKYLLILTHITRF